MEKEKYLIVQNEIEEVSKKYLIAKRIFDILVSFIGLCCCIPVFLIVSILIKIDSKGPILYKSVRVGRDCRKFYIYKFRTMYTNREELKANLSHSQMVTRIGKVLRKTSIDELPQLFNIFIGQMSFIGPRPWIPLYYDNFNEEQKKRSLVVPGISGLAQVKGRNGLTIFEKISYDLKYINNMSLKNDLKIIYWTIVEIFKKTNAEISESGIKDEIADLKAANKIIKYNCHN